MTAIAVGVAIAVGAGYWIAHLQNAGNPVPLISASQAQADSSPPAEGERKILVFISGSGPGFANDNRISIVDRVMKRDFEITGVAITERGEGDGGGELSQDDYVFGELTGRTGGRLERTLSVMGTNAAMQRVAADLRSTYRLGYLPSNSGKRSRIELQVARPSVRVRLSKPRKETTSP